MVEPTVNKKFWGCWNRLPFPDCYPEVTSTWLKKPDEQLSDSHLLKKTLQRQLFLTISGQRKYWRQVIPAECKKILWLHISDNLGDSLMRLSSIQLLKDFQVDLYASGAATQLFESGGAFNAVYKIDSDAETVSNTEYDLVIIDALQTKPLKQKINVAKNTPFVTLHEYFHFCRDDYNPTCFSWWRMQYLLGKQELSSPQLTMDISAEAKRSVAELNIPQDAIAIVVGGREAYRTYKAWDVVAAEIIKKYPNKKILLLGSENGQAIAEGIAKTLGDAIVNCVAQYSLQQTAEIIRQCEVLLCADGGLLHVANAVGTKTIALFAQEIPMLRYTEEDDYQALAVDSDVNEVPADEIVELLALSN